MHDLTDSAQPAPPEAPWKCPDPLCGGFLDRHKRKRVAIDPRTGKEVGLGHELISGVGFGLQYLIWIGGGYVLLAFFPGQAIHSPLATVFGVLDVVAGLGASFTMVQIAHKRRDAALARAVWYAYYRCRSCWRWGLPPEDVLPKASSVESDGTGEEESPAT